MRAAYAMRHTLAMNDGPAGRYPDAGSKGMGTHQSALSGTAVARMVQQYLRGRAKMQ